MYLLVDHHVTDPTRFWPADVESFKAAIPAHLKLHHAFAARDGSHCGCLWEAESEEALRSFLDAALGDTCRNVYHEVVNHEGIATPTTVPA